MNGLTIGKLAARTGMTRDTIRFYERSGLILEPQRSPSNYRIYPEDDVSRLTFIKKAKELGFSLNEISELLSIQHDPAASQSDIKKRIKIKIQTIRRRIKDLTGILNALEQLDEACSGHGSLSNCPILAALHGSEKN